MKVDKAVCTSDVLEDLSRAIKFEAVFTTLVENKIVAIKRECEEKAKLKKAKKRRFPFGRRLFGGTKSRDEEDVEKGAPTGDGKLQQDETPDARPREVDVKAEISEERQSESLATDSPRILNRHTETEASGSGVAVELDHYDIVSIRSDMCRTGDATAAVEVATGEKLSQSDDVIFRTKPPRRQARARFKEDVVETPCIEVKSVKSTKRKYNLREASLLLEQERHRLRILEAKSISAQCSPILPRHQPSDSPNLSLESRHSAPPVVSDPRVPPAHDSAPRSTRMRRESGPSHHEASVNYQASNPLSQGFVSSFNQLTTSHLPVMATAKSKTPCDMIKMHRMSPGKSRQDDAIESSFVGDSLEEDSVKKKKSWHKRAHRLSDPVLVYPSTSGLQHCILSRPPNQPIDLPYDEDFIYDVSLQIDPERSGDVEAVIPGQRRHKHKHHKHCKKKRHKRRKILVHDLVDQSVKVIDPDDLPKRARWTIIATACLLLVMCLLLVGVTLRMAPIIDDMVRQENERLMQESLNRAKFAKNFTDAASLTAQEEIP